MFEFVSGRTAGEVVPQRSQGAIVILRVEEPFPGLENRPGSSSSSYPSMLFQRGEK
jgi:hypothetical protein